MVGDKMIPAQRRFVGIMLTVIGVIAMLMSAGVIALISSARAESSKRFTELQTSCVARLRPLGGKVDEIPGRIIWSKENIEEAPARLGEASVVAVLCPGWRMKTACVGSQCPEPNAMRIVLEPTTEQSE